MVLVHVVVVNVTAVYMMSGASGHIPAVVYTRTWMGAFDAPTAKPTLLWGDVSGS
jgi:hypothetical protein